MVLAAEELGDLAARFRNARSGDDVAVLEGFHAVKHALRFGARLRSVVATDPGALEALAGEIAPDVAARLSTLVQQVPPDFLRTLGPYEPHTGVVALADRPKFRLSAVLERRAPIILLEGPRNLSNVGAAIRVAAAGDAAGVLTTGMQDPWDPSSLRGSAGLHFALPVGRVPEVPVTDRPVVALHPEGPRLRPESLPSDGILAFGTERHGLSPALLGRADELVSIPMRDGVSSLNLATSVAAVLMSWRLAGG